MAEPSGGYDYEFVNTPSDNLICKICHYPSKKPHLSVCYDHTLCKLCLEAAKLAKSVDDVCPMCRSKDFVTHLNKLAD